MIEYRPALIQTVLPPVCQFNAITNSVREAMLDGFTANDVSLPM